MEFTAVTKELTDAAMNVARLLPSQTIQPVLAGLLIEGRGHELVLAGTDREHAVRLRCPAMVHTDVTVLVPGRPLADTLRALTDHEVRATVEGSRLALYTTRARFGLPLLDVHSHPGVAEPPPLAGRIAGGPGRRAFTTVAGAASRDGALPLFTGVRLRARGDTLRLVATDRYRLAAAELPWQPASGSGDELDLLVPATLLTEIARQSANATEFALHADGDRAAVAWDRSVVSTALLATPFPDESHHVNSTGDALVEISAEELAGAVRRVAPYAGVRGKVAVQLTDGELRVHADSPENGEAEESIKASVAGRLVQYYQARYLLDALRAFDTERVRLDIKAGMRSTVVRATQSAGLALCYVVMPILPNG